MEHFRYLINLSVLDKRIPKPLTMEIAQTINSLTFVDRVDYFSEAFAIGVVHDEVCIFDGSGKEVGIEDLHHSSTIEIAERVAKLNDGITVIGYERTAGYSTRFVLADAYQEYQPFGKQGNGWLSPTFGPAYFKWVLQGEPLFRYCVLKNGFAGMSKNNIERCIGGAYCIIRIHYDGIFQNDERVVYYANGGIDD